MNRKLYVLPVIVMLFFFLSAVFFDKTVAAEETEIGIIASGACGVVHYDFDEENMDKEFEIDESVKYRLYKDGTMVISGIGEMGDFNTWCYEDDTWYRQKELMPWYDHRSDIKRVVVEKGVTSIGGAAFRGCRNLESIQWADSIEWIGGYAFYGCKKLKSIPWTENIEWVGGAVFQKCSSLKEVRLPSYVKRWGEDVFAECKGLKKATFNAGFQFQVRYIEKGDWEYIKEIEKIPPVIKYCGGNGMFRGCTSLKEVKLPKDLLVIPDYFVEGCTSLKTFSVPNSVIYWGSCPPSLCRGKYVLPESVSRLGNGAFAGCSDLEKVVLPEGLVYMDRAFEGCSSLKTLKIPKSVRKLHETFYNCTGLESIVIPNNVKKLENSVFEGCSNLKHIVLSNSIKFLDDYLFKDCISLKKIDLPPDLREIGAYTFYNCISLKKINLPSNLEIIEDSSFEYCSSLKEIRFPAKLKRIGSSAFSGCTSLEKIDLPKRTKKLSLFDKVFYNCKKLKSVTVRANALCFWGGKIFCGCKKLSQITLYAEEIERIEKHTFEGIKKKVTIYVPKNCVSKFKKQFKKAKIDMSNIEIKPMK